MFNFNPCSNMNVTFGDSRIEDVLTVIGKVIDVTTGNGKGTFEKIGSLVDGCTKDVDIRIGKKQNK